MCHQKVFGQQKKRVRGILEAPVPQNKSELKPFIGLMSYNVPSLATIRHPLYKLLRKEQNGHGLESKSWQSSLLEI